MPASINDLGNAVFYSFLMFLVLVMVGLPVPIGLFLCHIVVFVACVIAGNWRGGRLWIGGCSYLAWSSPVACSARRSSGS